MLKGECCMEDQDFKAQTTNGKIELPEKESNQSKETEGNTTTEFLDFDLEDIEVIESKVFA
jgi:hypothetical protein